MSLKWNVKVTLRGEGVGEEGIFEGGCEEGIVEGVCGGLSVGGGLVKMVEMS